MADKKISALTALAQGDVVVSTDVLPIVDTSATETKKIAVNALVGAAAAAGLTNVDINSGTIDGTTIATSDITVGSGKTLNVSAGTLTLADNQISGDKVEGGTINAITINTLTSTAVNATTVDATNVEVTNIKAKDGTAAATIADSTGIVSLSANPTLSGGTANGVLYLNGSKVATSGSALVFDGTNLGIGTSSPAVKLDVVGTVQSNGAFSINGTATGSASKVWFGSDGASGGFINVPTSQPLNIYQNNATLVAQFSASGNLGLGVTPSAWGNTKRAIQVGSGGSIYGDTTATSQMISLANAFFDGTNLKYIGSAEATQYRQNAGVHSWWNAPSGTAGNNISFTQALTLDASGNLIGGGKTSASLTTAGFELASDGSLLSTKSSTNTNLATNNGGSLQLTNSSATDGNFSNIGAYNSNGLVVSQIDFINVSHASRTGDIAFLTHNGSSLLERARIDSSGNLGLGVTPSAWGAPFGSGVLEISGGYFAGTSASNVIRLSSNNFYNGTNYIYKTSAEAAAYVQSSGAHQWQTAASGTAGNAITWTTAMTLDASGRLGIGVTNPSVGLVVAYGTDGIIGNFYSSTGVNSRISFSNTSLLNNNVSIGSASDAMVMYTNNTERARITSGGVFMVGTTGLPAANGTAMSLSGSGNVARIYGTTEASAALQVDKSSNTNTSSQVFVQFTISDQTTGSGQINANGANQAAFGSFSDRRLKDNIVDLASQWDNIKTLRPVEFDYIQSEGGGHQIGFIAQEVEEVYPDLVGKRSDEMLTLSGMGKGEARLIKALQEAMARIEKLEAEVAALKGV